MDLARLQQQLQHPALAPVETWDPPFCGDLPLLIDAKGDWYYQDSKITRLPLIELFARVLLRQGDEYFLQTPVEKVRIKVVDVPFIITQSQWQQGKAGPELWLTTNLGDAFTLSVDYSLVLRPFAGQIVPYVQLWRGLQARLHRNVYYHLLHAARVEQTPLPQQHPQPARVMLSSVIESAGQRFVLAEEPVLATDT